MSGSPLTKIAGIGFGAALVLALMFLFTLNQVADTSAPQTAKYIDSVLEGNLDPKRPTRVTMTRDAKGANPPRTYIVRLHPLSRIASDPRALKKLCENARDRVYEQVETVAAPVTVLCAAETGGEPVLFAWRRVGTDDAGFKHEVLDPPPPLPKETAEPARDAEGDEE